MIGYTPDDLVRQLASQIADKVTKDMPQKGDKNVQPK